MIHGKLHKDGSLTDMTHRHALTYADGAVDVPLVKMPEGFGPFVYDEKNKIGVLDALTHAANEQQRKANEGKMSGDERQAMLRTVAKLTGKPLAEVETAFAQESQTEPIEHVDPKDFKEAV